MLTFQTALLLKVWAVIIIMTAQTFDNVGVIIAFFKPLVPYVPSLLVLEGCQYCTSVP